MRLPDDLILKSISLRDEYFDLRGLSRYSALSVSTLRYQIKRNRLPFYQLRGKLLVRRSEFDLWIKQFRAIKLQDIDKLVDEIVKEILQKSRSSCIICKNTEVIEQAHIVPKRFGGNETIPLCANCHIKYDKNRLSNKEKESVQSYLSAINYRNNREIFPRLPKKIEDRIDLEAARKALKESGSVPWEKVKTELGL